MWATAIGVIAAAVALGATPPSPPSSHRAGPATTTSVPVPESDVPVMATTSIPLPDADANEPICDAERDHHATVDPSESARLEPVLGIIVGYGQQHPDSWAGSGLRWTGDGTAVAFASFSRDVATHRDALSQLVPDGGDLEVCRAVMNEQEIRSLHAQLVDELDGRFSSLGMSSRDGRITVGLFAADEALAVDLRSRFGDRVTVTVGRFPFPMPDPLPAAECGELPEELSAGPTLAVAVPAGPIDVSARASVTVTITNETAVAISFGLGDSRAVAVDGGTEVTAKDWAEHDMLELVSLEPGESVERELRIATATCDPADGYVIGPGDHQLRVIIEPVDTVGFDAAGAALVSAPIPITV